jgi:hypothetical protein
MGPEHAHEFIPGALSGSVPFFVEPAAASNYLGMTADPDLSQTASPVTLSATKHNLGLLYIAPNPAPYGGTTSSNWVSLKSLVFNVVGAPLTATHAWGALFTPGGSPVAVSADTLAVQRPACLVQLRSGGAEHLAIQPGVSPRQPHRDRLRGRWVLCLESY